MKWSGWQPARPTNLARWQVRQPGSRRPPTTTDDPFNADRPANVTFGQCRALRSSTLIVTPIDQTTPSHSAQLGKFAALLRTGLQSAAHANLQLVPVLVFLISDDGDQDAVSDGRQRFARWSMCVRPPSTPPLALIGTTNFACMTICNCGGIISLITRLRPPVLMDRDIVATLTQQLDAHDEILAESGRENGANGLLARCAALMATKWSAHIRTATQTDPNGSHRGDRWVCQMASLPPSLFRSGSAWEMYSKVSKCLSDVSQFG